MTPESNPAGDVTGSPADPRDDHASGARPGDDIVVRLADGDDLDGVVTVGRTAWQTNSANFIPEDILELLLAKWWTKDANVSAIRAGRTFVAERGGEIVGMAAYGVHEGSLVVWKVYVLPDAQGLGIGGRLLDAVYRHAPDGHDHVYLSLTDGNVSGLAFARAQGFVEDRREAQSGMPDLVWMRRDVAPSHGTDPTPVRTATEEDPS